MVIQRMELDPNQQFRVLGQNGSWTGRQSYNPDKPLDAANIRKSLHPNELTLVDVKVVMDQKIYNVWNAASDRATVITLTQSISDSSTREIQEAIFRVDANTVGIRTTTNCIWLDEGTERAGLRHILLRHQGEFQLKQIGPTNVSAFLRNLLNGERPSEVLVGREGGQELHYVIVNRVVGQFKVIIVVANNGYIVTAHPTELNWREYHQLAREAGDETYMRWIGASGYSQS